MAKRWFLSFIISLLALHSTGQEVIYSNYEKFNINTGDFEVVGKINGLIYTYRATEDGYFLDAYNDSMNKMATVVLDFFPKKIYAVHFITYRDKMIVLYQNVESKTIVVQYAALLDAKGRLQGQPKKLDEVRTGMLGPTRSYFKVAHSLNKNQVVVYKITNSRKAIDFNGFWISPQLEITKKLNTSFNNSLSLEGEELHVANDGTIYLPAKSSEGLKDYSKHFSLLYMPIEEKSFSSSPLVMGEKYMTDYFLKIDENIGIVYLSGIYANSKNGNFDGAIYATRNLQNQEWQLNNYYPFSDSLRQQSGTESKKAFNDFNIKQLITKKDGGFVMIAEDNYVQLQTDYRNSFGYYSFYMNPMMARSVRQFYFGDVLVVSYDGNGQNTWHKFIRKRQYSFEDGGVFSSYGLINSGSDLAFLYNDYDHRRSSVQLSVLSHEGQLEGHSLGNSGSDDPDWLPKSGKQIGAKEMIVPCLARRKLCFARIVF